MTSNHTISTLFFSIFLPTIFLGCSKASDQDKTKPERPPVRVQIADIQRRDIDKLADVVGTLYGDEEVEISSKVNGRITTIPIDMGDRIAGDGLLAQIDPVDFQLEVEKSNNALSEALAKLGLTEIPGKEFDISSVATVERALAQSANAKSRLERAKKLFEQSPPLISEQDYTDLQTQVKVADSDVEVAKLEVKSQLATAMSRKSDLAKANQQLKDTRIVAPPLEADRKYAIAQRSVSVGEYVREGSAMFKLVIDDKIKFRGSLPERYFDQVSVGQVIRIYLTGHDTASIGKISRISPTIDLATRTFQIEATFDNSRQALRPGVFVRGEIVTGQHTGVPLVPKKAVLSFAGVDKVFIPNGLESAERIVTLGTEKDGMISIPKGLTDEEVVIVSNLGQLANKTRIEIEPTTQPANQVQR